MMNYQTFHKLPLESKKKVSQNEFKSIIKAHQIKEEQKRKFNEKLVLICFYLEIPEVIIRKTIDKMIQKLEKLGLLFLK